MTDSPSALLERAAERLAELANKASPGPWDASQGSEIYAADGFCVVSTHWDGAGFERADDQDWCATMSPAVAQPLVEWLRDESEYIRGIRSWKFLPPNTRRAVAFARVVLGEPENTP